MTVNSPNGQPKTKTGPEMAYELDQNYLELPRVMKILPMAELNSFPNLTSSICVDEDISRSTVIQSFHEDGFIALFALKNFDIDTQNPKTEDFYPVGVAVKVMEVKNEREDQYMKVSVRGLKRVILGECLPGSIPHAVIHAHPQEVWDDIAIAPMVMEAKRLFAALLNLIPGLPTDLLKINRLFEKEPAVLADLIMASLPLRPEAKTEFLHIQNVESRFIKLLEHLSQELTFRETGRAITQRVEESLGRQHQEKRLREQIRAIQMELGESDEHDEIATLEEKIQSLNLPPEVLTSASRELKRLRLTPPQSAERGVIRQFLDWVTDLPWNKASSRDNSLGEARAILERDHYGLDKVKKRILEYLAVRQLTPNHRGPILCLTGPPGVGKTSLAKSIAEALGREFVHLSLGGVRDEAEIRGHRRTYVGARPGRIISGVHKAGVNNPVFLLDEIDKMTNGAQGDPAAALLEALDFEQNDSFTDHYLEMPFDLSKVLFILTANVLDNIPRALRDRLEVVEISSYSALEKVAIARRHLWPREVIRHGLANEPLTISDETLGEIIENYTYESGCRGLNRHLRTLIRSRAVDKAEGRPLSHVIQAPELATILGPPRLAKETRQAHPQVGVATGLAWTAAGGDLMFVECVAMPGHGRLELTGQLGEVMRESAKAAISYARSKARYWGLDEEWFKHHDIHIHLPQGAIPKDGPSAGVSLVAALVSLISGSPIRSDTGLTGEISLRGLVLPVGGLKEKLLAAKRAGLATVLVPAKNTPDLAELPKHLTEGLEIRPVTSVDEVLSYALVGWPGQAFPQPQPQIQAPRPLESHTPQSPNWANLTTGTVSAY
ncbi:MAG: endopeptidase La [Deltaproteobacteria bacterium]|jgi:ATP-dependent Lon protease|nr:endopeptidase La [Deltaproteobacteria bacterium]